MLVKAEAVVLRSIDYGETSQIVTLFTLERGKVTVMAKGARRTKSRFGATLQPMSHSEFVFYYREGRDLHTLRESGRVRLYSRLSSSLTKTAVGLRAVELVYALLQQEEQNPQVFRLLVGTLAALDVAEIHAANLLPYFELRLAGALGFAPDIDREFVQALPEEGGVLALETGAILPSLEGSSAAARRASRAALRAFAILARADLGVVLRMRLDAATRSEVFRLTEDFLRYHVDTLYPSRGEQVVAHLIERGEGG